MKLPTVEQLKEMGLGCSNHGCIVFPKKEGEMGTNAICKCHLHPKFAIWARLEIQALRNELRMAQEDG